MTMPLRAAIFDMDGLMIDSERIYTECSNAVLAEWGKTLTWEVKATLMGRPAHESAKRLVAATGVPISPEEFSARMDALLAPAFRHVQPLPGIQRLIDHLVEHEVPIAIATGSKRSNFNIKSSNLGPLFQPFGDRVVCGDDETVIGRGKPDPAIFHEAAKMLGITEPEQLAECLVFEDGLQGVEAALAGGMQCVWVPDPNLVQVVEQTPAQGQEPTLTLSSLELFDPAAFGLPAFKA